MQAAVLFTYNNNGDPADKPRDDVNQQSIQYPITATDNANGCVGTQTVITQPVNPAPVISTAPQTSICNGTFTSNETYRRVVIFRVIVIVVNLSVSQCQLEQVQCKSGNGMNPHPRPNFQF